MNPDNDSALGVTTRIFEALNQRDWQRAAELIDDDDVEEWYRSSLAQYAAPQPVSLGDMLRLLPEVAAALPDAHFDEMRRTRELYTGLGSVFPGISSAEELASLTPRQALARFLQASDPSWRFEAYVGRLQESGLVPRSQCPDPPRRHRQVIGVLREDGDHAYLAYRCYWSDGSPQDPAEELKLAALRRSRAGWRLRRRGEIFEEAGFTIVAQHASEINA